MNIAGIAGGAGLQNLRQSMFERMDSDRSGGVSVDEMRAVQEARGGKRDIEKLFERADADGDGQVQMGEAASSTGASLSEGLLDRLLALRLDGEGASSRARLSEHTPEGAFQPMEGDAFDVLMSIGRDRQAQRAG